MKIKIGYRNQATGVITTDCPEIIKVKDDDCCGCDATDNPTGETLTFRYGCTTLDTTGNTILTDADYLASVDDEPTFVETGTFTDGGTIQALFKNTVDDKVCFIEVPEGQPAFTRFSVIGNSFVQNVLIKQALDGEYSVMFKSGNTYFSMAQTMFDGPVLLMH